uniref:Si:dkey-9k7.3 n=1 Tax=Scleropages formosus TaxID=113540 RepID=A0A8C9TTM3_SCLFO
MEFACSHVVCNWKPEGAAVQRHRSTLDSPVTEERPSISRPLSSSDHDYDNRVAVLPKPDISIVPPPLPPRQSLLHKQPQPKSAPPPVPPRGQEAKGEMRLKANVNVLSLNVGRLVDISKAAAIHCTRRPVYCSRCHAAMSSLSNLQSKQSETVWPCEFCGQENKIMSTDPGAKRTARQNLPGRDIIYLSEDSDGDYINLEDMLVVFCVDISGSMSVTYEVTPGNSTRSPTYVSRLQSVQDALQRALSSLLHSSPHRRVALVTFNDEVTVYGDGTGAPLTLRDWSLVDFDHLKEQGKQYCTPHCIAESIHPLNQKIKEMQEHGATALGPAALVSIAMASRYTGSKVIICTDGQANIGLGAFEQGSEHAVSYCPYFYSQLAKEAVDKGVIVSVLTFEGTDCRLAEVGRLADYTGGRVSAAPSPCRATEQQGVREWRASDE